MKLKQLTKLLFAVSIVFILASCNSSDSDYSYDLSADAQIYSFAVSAKMTNAIDSINFPILKKTKFAIDQSNQYIYNPDTLPYGTRLTKYLANIGFSSFSSPSKAQLKYLDISNNDSIVDWNTSDSIDFSTKGYPKIIITAQNGKTHREYDIDFRIYDVDQDIITWDKINTFDQTSIKTQRTLFYNNTFYTFSIDNDNSVYLRKAPRNTQVYGTKQPIGKALNLESITLFNGNFYALDNNNQSYSSPASDGVNWTSRVANVTNILGILPNIYPDIQPKHGLLVIANNKFGTTKDMLTIEPVNNITIPTDFPGSGYSSVTSFDKNDPNKNILTITGGKVGSNYVNITRYFLVKSGKIEMIANQPHSTFEAKQGIVSFLYNNYMYALTGNQFYKSTSLGANWFKASAKEDLDTNIPKAYGQSVIVDNENYIWIFGGVADSGTNPIQQVWRGRLNKYN
ncbi:MAG: DUF6242 domain-containing protein [Dysgonomonas sp.]|nr:DUF6242 domain-containing protein [Dysgonomonas sp.]